MVETEKNGKFNNNSFHRKRRDVFYVPYAVCDTYNNTTEFDTFILHFLCYYFGG